MYYSHYMLYPILPRLIFEPSQVIFTFQIEARVPTTATTASSDDTKRAAKPDEQPLAPPKGTFLIAVDDDLAPRVAAKGRD